MQGKSAQASHIWSHESHTFLLVQPCWPKRLGFLSRGRFSPAQLILSDLHFRSQHTEARVGKALEGRKNGLHRMVQVHSAASMAPKEDRCPLLKTSGLMCQDVSAQGTVLPYCKRVCSALLRVTESLKITQSWWKWQIYLFILCGHKVNLIKPGDFQSAIKVNWWNVLNYTSPIFLWFWPPHLRDRILEHINWWKVPQSPKKDGRTSGLFTFSHKYHSSSLWGKSLF